MKYTQGKLLARNTVYTILGQGAPIIVALWTIPALIRGLGKEQFGILTLTWMLIGYFSLFDLGLGRAVTKLVAEKMGDGRQEEIPGLVWTSLALMISASIVTSLVLFFIAPRLVQGWFKIPGYLHGEAIATIYLIGLTIPAVVCTAGLQGVLEARQCFGVINSIRVLMGITSYVLPLLVLQFQKGLIPVVWTLVGIRYCVLAVNGFICIREVPSIRKYIKFRSDQVKPLLSLGGWITVSNLVGPLLITLDRLLIGSLISVAAVTYYATPYEMMVKLLIVPSAFGRVFFPAFSASFVNDKPRAEKIFSKGLKYLFIIYFPIILMICAFAYEGLRMWVGHDMADNSTVVMQVLSLTMLLAGFAYIPFSLVQSIGRADLAAKLYILELPFYGFLLWGLTKKFGIHGSAAATLLRVIVDMIVLFYFSVKAFNIKKNIIVNSTIVCSTVLASCMSFIFIKSLATRSILFGCVIVLYAAFIGLILFDKEEKLEIYSNIFFWKKRQVAQASMKYSDDV